MGLQGKVIFVAGVGSGLGSAVVCLLASQGATVVGVARGSKVLDQIAAHARLRGWKFSPRTADLTDQAQVDRTVRSVLDEFGHIDGVSINIGHWLGGETLLHRMSDDEWSVALRDNLDPVFRVARATLPPLMKQGHGSVVLVSAAPAVRHAGSVSYSVAKGGLADVIPQLAGDYRSHGVRINAVLPGSMSKEVAELDPPNPDRPIALTDTTATGPWEVAGAIRYLLSDESRWVTGSLLLVDGGASSGGKEPTTRPLRAR
jgi:NAD(P)-dependent dehydrogenase (short-subunit alcohol dehydrogenase family)